METATATGEVTAAGIIRTMHRVYSALPGNVRFDLFPAVYGTTYAQLGMQRNTPEGIHTATPIAEGALTLLLRAAGVADDGTDRTPACMATIGQACEIMAVAADETLLLAHLVGVVPTNH
ncbi:hypothetical protein AB0A95_33430 [Micromonospora sp. NPDC049230]|uniref:hypothetical protein n=1 Tax=Micromonospora sp. NPDC049230 TaxID=3155502 RepID=UPI0033DECBD5